MNTYSRALRHTNMEDVKQKHQQKLIEEKQQRKLEREEKKYIQSVMKEIKYDWRKELNEQMTSSEVFFTTLPATGETTVATQSGATLSGNSTPGFYGISSGLYNFAQNVDTMVFTVTAGVGQLQIISSVGNIYGAFGAGTHTVSLRPSDINKGSSFLWFVTNGLETSGFGTWTISNVQFQRRTPMNVFVSLDSPEATSFIRTEPNLSNLSPEEKNKKLREMLNASDEYVMKIFGGKFPGTGAVPPGEFDPFAQPALGKAGDTPGVDIDNWIAGGLYPSNKYDPIKSAPYIQDPKIYGGGGKSTSPNVNPWDDNDPSTWPSIKNLIKQASDDQNKKKKDSVVVAHYEPQGEVITERKKLKSPEEILNKIPGYYDGKPAPLGFPVEQPPKMVNGMHPDLVDGKKTADRFNRMDPESAKAMPLTGNPHIDKKVKAARKKPK